MNIGIDDPVSARQMMATGATYRQIDHWTRSGWLSKSGEEESAAPGSGTRRAWTGREYRIASLMVRLINLGMRPRPAARMARASIDHGVNSVATEDGVTVSWRSVA